MAHEPWQSEVESNANLVEETSQVSDGSEETLFDYEDVRDYDLGEGD